jgi:hypothetical protein
MNTLIGVLFCLLFPALLFFLGRQLAKGKTWYLLCLIPPFLMVLQEPSQIIGLPLILIIIGFSWWFNKKLLNKSEEKKQLLNQSEPNEAPEPILEKKSFIPFFQCGHCLEYIHKSESTKAIEFCPYCGLSVKAPELI